MKTRLHDLIDAHLDGRLTTLEKAELEALLLASPEARQEFWSLTTIHGLLHEAVRLKKPATTPRPAALPWLALAASLAIALVGGYALLRTRTPPATAPTLTATAAEAVLVPVQGTLSITRGNQSQTVRAEMPLQAGDTIHVAADSAASIRYADGTRLHLAENSRLMLEGPELQQIELATGRIQAEVAAQGTSSPVALRTPLARLTVHGTRFTLDARSRATRLDVTEGLVRMVHAQRDSDMDIGAGQFAVAVSDAPLLGGVTPTDSITRPDPGPGDRDYAQQPFRSDSPWNQSLAADTRLTDIASPAFDLAGHGLAIHPASHDREIVVARADDPQVTVIHRYDGSPLLTLPLPSSALASPGRLRNVTVIDATTSKAYELIQADRAGDTVRAMLVYANDLRGAGLPPDQVGHTWSSLPLAAGVIRAGELQTGIRHALAASALHTALSRTPAPAVWPARAAPMERKLIDHMAAGGNVHFGTRLALPADLDLRTLGVGTSGPAYEIALALQRYGVFVTHSYGPAPGAGSGGWVQPHLVLFAEASEPELRQLSATLSRLAGQLKIVETPVPENQ